MRKLSEAQVRMLRLLAARRDGLWRTYSATKAASLGALVARGLAEHPQACVWVITQAGRDYLTQSQEHGKLVVSGGERPQTEEIEMARQTTNRSLKNCACSKFYAEEIVDGDLRVYNTGCVRQTNNTFVQGHDAKLVSFLVKAETAGDKIYTYADPAHVALDAQSAAAKISDSLAAKAEKAVIAWHDRKARQRQPKAKAAAPRKVAVKVAEAPAVEAKPVEIIKGKVGRWEYEGVAYPDGSFVYRAGSGETKTAAAGKWTKVEG